MSWHHHKVLPHSLGPAPIVGAHGAKTPQKVASHFFAVTLQNLVAIICHTKNLETLELRSLKRFDRKTCLFSR